MRLLSFEIEIEFAEEIRVPSLSQRVHRAITGKTPPQYQKPSEPGVNIRSIKRKLVVLWTTNSCSIQVEHFTSPGDCIHTIVTLLNTINAVVPINQFRKRLATTQWLLPAPSYKIAALEQKYRETMISRQFVQHSIFDSSVILDIKTNDWTLHHQSGAMGIKQLLDDYLFFKPENVPNTFLFLLASIIDEKMVQYSSEEIHDYLTKSFDLCSSHSNRFERIWEGIL